MLAAAQRLRRREDFAATIRNGRRAGRGALVVHFLQSTIEPAPADQPSARAGFVVSAPVAGSSSEMVDLSDITVVSGLTASEPSAATGLVPAPAGPVDKAVVPVGKAVVPARAGFVVSKAVGNAVVRNMVKRRLRHLVRRYMADLPPASMIVVRALPASATAAYEDLGRDLDAALSAACRPRSREGRR